MNKLPAQLRHFRRIMQAEIRLHDLAEPADCYPKQAVAAAALPEMRRRFAGIGNNPAALQSLYPNWKISPGIGRAAATLSPYVASLLWFAPEVCAAMLMFRP